MAGIDGNTYTNVQELLELHGSEHRAYEQPCGQHFADDKPRVIDNPMTDGHVTKGSMSVRRLIVILSVFVLLSISVLIACVVVKILKIDICSNQRMLEVRNMKEIMKNLTDENTKLLENRFQSFVDKTIVEIKALKYQQNDTEVRNMKGIMKNLTDENTKLLENRFQSFVDKTNVEIEALKYQQNDTEVRNMKGIMKNLTDENTKLLENRFQSFVDKTIVEIEALKYQQNDTGGCGKEPKYAFFAILTKDLIYPVAKDKVKFDRVVTNKGSAYDAKTGIFTCKNDGTYYFEFIASGPRNQNDHFIHLLIKKHQDTYGFVIIDGNRQQWRHGSSSAVLDLDIGDEVYIEVFEVRGYRVLAGSTKILQPASYSHFLGYTL